MLAPLGADITGSQFLDPDGSFPNHICNPEHPSAMAAGAKATTAAKADLGIVFDTDVDRYVCVCLCDQVHLHDALSACMPVHDQRLKHHMILLAGPPSWIATAGKSTPTASLPSW